MITVNIHEAKTTLSRLLKKIAEGEKVVICNNGKPVADLVEHKEELKRRIPGGYEGKILMAPDFDEPDEELERLFYEVGPDDPLREFSKE